MDVRLIDLDDNGASHAESLAPYRPTRLDLRAWGPHLRLACSLGQFRRFELDLACLVGTAADARPIVTLYGSGDFHHTTLALLRRQTAPFNLLLLDKHPDWVRGVPFLHCGTWLAHALRLPLLKRVYHAGGDLDFDNFYRWAAPWSELRSGRLTVFPAVRAFTRGAWSEVRPAPLRTRLDTALDALHLGELLRPHRSELAARPLYVSLDKDVMRRDDAVVNWDSGYLSLAEVGAVVGAFLDAAQGRLAGMDVLGDWSPVRLRGSLRRLLHRMEHPTLAVEAREAAAVNAMGNRALLGCVADALAGRSRVA